MCNQNHVFFCKGRSSVIHKTTAEKFPIFLAKVAPKSVSLHRKVAPKSVWQSKKVAPKNVNMFIFKRLKNGKKSNIFF